MSATAYRIMRFLIHAAINLSAAINSPVDKPNDLLQEPTRNYFSEKLFEDWKILKETLFNVTEEDLSLIFHILLEKVSQTNELPPTQSAVLTSVKQRNEWYLNDPFNTPGKSGLLLNLSTQQLLQSKEKYEAFI